MTVTATRAKGGVYTATTNANGIYALANVPSASSYSLTAAKTGYTFSPQNVSTGTSSNYSTTSGDVWGANFTAAAAGNTWTLTVNSSPAQGAAVTGTYPGTTNYSIPSIADGTAVSLAAPAAFVSGGTTYNFIQWAVPAGWTASGATVSGSIHSNTTLAADYAAQVWTLTVNSTPVQGVGDNRDVSRDDELLGLGRDRRHGGEPGGAGGDPAGYTFSQWTVNGAAQPSGQKSITFTMAAATTAVAQYTANTYTLTVQSTPPTGLSIGSSTGDGGTTNYTVPTVAYGTSVNLQAPATDPAGYTFSQWTVNGAAQTAGQKSITFTMTAAMTAVAQYTLNTYTLTVQSTPPTGLSIGSSTGDGGTTNYHGGERRVRDEREPAGAGDGPGRIHLLAVDGERRGADRRAEVHHVHDGCGHDGGGAVHAEQRLHADRAVHAADRAEHRFEHGRRRDDELSRGRASRTGRA